MCISNFQAGAQRLMGLMASVFSGLPCTIQCGRLGPSSFVASLPQIIIDMEACDMVNFFLKGVEVNQDTLAFDVIKNVGIGGNFLSEEHTAANFRRAVWLPQIFQRVDPGVWNKSEKDPVQEAARQKVQEILKNHNPCYLNESQEKEIARILKMADEKLG
jgi:trimethylamine--corrinoid protein Co-methyltransferase